MSIFARISTFLNSELQIVNYYYYFNLPLDAKLFLVKLKSVRTNKTKWKCKIKCYLDCERTNFGLSELFDVQLVIQSSRLG